MSIPLRVRFAPSPTGFLHVGGLRTALYNYLFARQNNGIFVLRIEDTDRTRYVEGAVESLIKTLKQVGLTYDEGPGKEGNYGPYIQSENKLVYNVYVKELLQKEKAYYCFCTPEALAEMREKQKEEKQMVKYDGRCRNLPPEDIRRRLKSKEKFVIRAKIPQEGEFEFNDLIRGKVVFPWDMVDDQILIKSDGYPTYHIANVVDDYLMEINSVIRGEEWLSSTPKHLFLYDAFGWRRPQFAHLPLLLNPDKSKLSKRQGDVAVEDFLAKGYLPEALLNFVALLGWHDANDREIFSLKELEEVFSLERITKSGAVFDVEKLKWMNGYYIRNMNLEKLAGRLRIYFEREKIDIKDNKKYLKIVEFARERITLLPEIIDQARVFYENLTFDEESKQLMNGNSAQQLYSFWLKELNKQTVVTEEFIEELIKKSSTELGIKGKDLYFPLRLALFGQVHGPNIPLLFRILGREEFLERLKRALA